jgi:hypothetical protein
MKMSQPLRIEYPEGVSSFITRRFRNSQLCYANNKPLESRILGSMGKYQEKYQFTLYAFTIFGSHDHPMINFKPGTKSRFFRDFGARTAEAVKKYVPNYGTGSVFERRTSEQAITSDTETHLDRVMYIILQPILAGLCKNLSDYPGFNSFKYLLSGEPAKVEFFNGYEYQKAKRRNKDIDRSKFIEKYDLTFSRIPGYEHLSQKEYRRMLQAEYEKRRTAIIEEYDKNGHKWPSPESLRKVKSTDEAKNPKKSTRQTKRPLVLSLCLERKQEFLNYYFKVLRQFKEASVEYLGGKRDAEFPKGTCIPPGPWC